MNNYLSDPDIQLISKEPPRHKQFVKMIQNFTKEKIMPRDFNLERYEYYQLVPYGNDLYGIVDNVMRNVFTSEGDFNIKVGSPSESQAHIKPEFIVKYCAEEYKRAKENHTNYWKWKNNRNEKRSELEEDHGYDTKHASHLVRLLRMGEEALTGKGIIVKRPDAKDLLDIRAGLWDYDDLVKWADEKDKYIRGKLYENSKLPKKPDIKLASKVLMETQDYYWG